METKLSLSATQHRLVADAKNLGTTQHTEHIPPFKSRLVARPQDEVERGRSRQVMKLWWATPMASRPAPLASAKAR